MESMEGSNKRDFVPLCFYDLVYWKIRRNKSWTPAAPAPPISMLMDKFRNWFCLILFAPNPFPTLKWGERGWKELCQSRARDCETKMKSHLLLPSMDSVFEELIVKMVLSASWCCFLFSLCPVGLALQGFWRLLRKGTSFTPTQVERFCSHYHFLCVRALLAKCATVVKENKDKETLLAICGAHV